MKSAPVGAALRAAHQVLNVCSMRRPTVFAFAFALSLLAACADPPAPIDESEKPKGAPSGAVLPPSSGTGIAGSGPDQPAPPAPPADPAPVKKQDPAQPMDPGAPGPKSGSSEKCNSASTFSISEWKKIDATQQRVDFDVVANIEGEMSVFDHDTDAVLVAGRSIDKPLGGGQPEGSFRGLTAVSGQRLLLRADWGDCLVVVVP
jgi:hypothetical protein